MAETEQIGSNDVWPAIRVEIFYETGHMHKCKILNKTENSTCFQYKSYGNSSIVHWHIAQNGPALHHYDDTYCCDHFAV